MINRFSIREWCRQFVPRGSSVVVYSVGLALTIVVTAHAIGAVATALMVALGGVPSSADHMTVGQTTAGQVTAGQARETRTAELMPTSDDFAAKLSDPAFWASRRVGGNGNSNGNKAKSSPVVAASWGKPSRLGVDPPSRPNSAFEPKKKPAPKDDDDDDEDTTYRTVCVRLCDGFFTPMSFATTREHFEADEKKCEASCSGQARLFVYKNPGNQSGDMEDVKGNPYRKLPTAFLFKTSYDASCKCRPHAWEQASLDRHKIYALELQRQKGSKTVLAEIKELTAKVSKAEADAAAERAARTNAAELAARSRTKVADAGQDKTKRTTSVPAKTRQDGAPVAADATRMAAVAPERPGRPEQLVASQPGLRSPDSPTAAPMTRLYGPKPLSAAPASRDARSPLSSSLPISTAPVPLGSKPQQPTRSAGREATLSGPPFANRAGSGVVLMTLGDKTIALPIASRPPAASR